MTHVSTPTSRLQPLPDDWEEHGRALVAHLRDLVSPAVHIVGRSHKKKIVRTTHTHTYTHKHTCTHAHTHIQNSIQYPPPPL
jgi:hypothetical protein